MLFRRFWAIALCLTLGLTAVACTRLTTTDIDTSNYNLRLLIIRADSDDYLEPYQHFANTMHANLVVETLHIKQLQAKHLSGIDVVYPDPSILLADGWRPAKFTELIQRYVAAGGHLFLESPFIDHLPPDLLGIAAWFAIEADRELTFTYPTVSLDLCDLQEVYSSFRQASADLQVLPAANLQPLRAARLSTATPLAEVAGGSVLAVNKYGDGTVTWTDELLPGREFISRLDFMPNQPEQAYFHFGYTTANWLFRNKYLNLVAKQKYGFALEKIFGAYHRPAMAWQNHFEVRSAFANRDIQNFTELLREYRQVPTFSLIRSTFNWSYWAPALSWLPNIGTKSEPLYEGMTADSVYSTGQRITMDDGRHFELGRYRGFSSLLGKLHTPTRAYPELVDLNGDGRPDLVIGTPDGEIFFLPNTAISGPPAIEQQIALKTTSGVLLQTAFAAPAAGDLNGNGLPDLVIGNEQGQLLIYANAGLVDGQPRFRHQQTLNPKLGAYTTPRLVDWDADGTLDLIVGTANGDIYLLLGIAGSAGSFQQAKLLLASGLQWAAPFAGDVDADGQLDLLIGSYGGQIALYKQVGANWVYKEDLPGANCNFFGNDRLNFGHNSVPLLVDWDGDGQVGLLLGGAEYGDPYALDDPANPAREGIKASIAYLQENHLPILAHSYVHEYKSASEEELELELHRQAFIDLGIEWHDMGVNHHTWRINKNALQTLKAEQAAGVCYNFGFRPYGSPGHPRDGKPFMPFVAPYRLTIGEEVQPFLLWAPVPEVQKFPQAYQAMLAFDLPLTYFDHIENRLAIGGQERINLESTIVALANIQQQSNYSFMTEAQIAKSIFNQYYSRLDVGIDASGITIAADTSQVPAQAAEYLGTNGVKFLPGANLAGKELSSDSWLQFRPDLVEELYVGLLGETKIVWEHALPRPPLEILCTNAPLTIIAADQQMIEIELSTTGMQQLVLGKAADLEVRGEDLLLDYAADTLKITHYGASCRIRFMLP